MFLCGFLFPRRLHYIHCTRVSADPFSCPLPSPVCQGQYFPTGQSTRTLMGWVVMETWHQKNYSTWSQAMMDNLAASTHPSYFKTSHSVVSKAVFYSRGTRLSTPFWARHNDMLALLSNHFCLCIM